MLMHGWWCWIGHHFSNKLVLNDNDMGMMMACVRSGARQPNLSLSLPHPRQYNRKKQMAIQTENALVAMGNPLLDILADVDASFLEKYVVVVGE